MSAEDEGGRPRKAELKAEAAISRARVADDLEALTHKLSPQNLKSEARQAIVKSVERRVSGAENRLSRLTSTLKRRVTEHPLPFVALVGLGIGLLAWRARRA